MKRYEAYPSKYLKAGDIDDSNGPVRATIKSVGHEAMQDGTIKPIVFFDKWHKGVVVNVTNADILYAIAGTDDDVDWPELTVDVGSELVRFQGKMVDSIRFYRPKAKPKAASKPVPSVKDEFNDDFPGDWAP